MNEKGILRPKAVDGKLPFEECRQKHKYTYYFFKKKIPKCHKNHKKKALPETAKTILFTVDESSKFYAFLN